MQIIDKFINNTPMYKVVIYSLLSIILVAFLESFFGLISYSPLSLFTSLSVILVICIFLNFLICKIFNLPIQYDSSIITALILFLILSPVDSNQMLYSAIIASVLATLSKYILVLRNTHIFNPAAFGAFFVTLLGFGSAFWWVGSLYLLPIVLIAGLLVVYKTERFTLFYAGLFFAFIGAVLISYFNNQNFLELLNAIFISGSTIFFLTIMLTEPHTITKNKVQQIFYAGLVVLLPTFFAITKITQIPPELALLIGNFASFYFSGRLRLRLKLKEIKQLSSDISEYIFETIPQTNKGVSFKSGQFMEWNLASDKTDSRGSRRYFTISSAPGENISFATKFPPADESSFKTTLKNLKIGDEVFATQLGGDFILPKNKKKNLAFIAGGIGITPFISHLRYLLKNNEQRNITLFYCVRIGQDIVFLDLLKEASFKLNTKVVFIVSEKESFQSTEHANFHYETGYINENILKKYLTNIHDMDYYISGPNALVSVIKKTLFQQKIKDNKVHTDYFPGF